MKLFSLLHFILLSPVVLQAQDYHVPAQNSIRNIPHVYSSKGTIKKTVVAKIDSIIKSDTVDYYDYLDVFSDEQIKQKLEAWKLALTLSESIQYFDGKASALRNIAVIESFKHIWPVTEASLKKLDTAVAFFSKTRNKYEEAKTWYAISYVRYANIHMYIAASFFKAVDLFIASGACNEAFSLFRGKVLIFLRWEDNEKTLKMFGNLVACYTRQYKVFEKLQAYCSAGDVYLLGLGQIDSAFLYYDKAHKLARINGINAPEIFFRLGFWYHQLARYDQALSFYQQALKGASNTQDVSVTLPVYIYTGGVYLSRNDPDKAGYWFGKALEILSVPHEDIWKKEPDNLLRYKRDLFGYFGQLDFKRGDEKAAGENLKKSKSFNDEYYIQRQWGIRFNRTLDRQSSVLEREIYKKDLETKQLTIRRGQFAKASLVIILVVVMMLISFIYYRYRLKIRLNEILTSKVEDALENQRQQQRIIIHQAGLASLGEMAAGMAGEINEPLQTILLAAGSIHQETLQESPDSGFIKTTVREQITDVSRIRQFMDHIRLFSSQQRTEMTEPFSVNGCIRDACLLIQKQFESDGIRLDHQVKADICSVSGNPYKFEQVVLNLLYNARDAMNEKDANFMEGYHKQIRIVTREEEEFVILEIADNGIGIEEKEMKRIFQPFFTTKDRLNSAGLGLSISQGIIEEMKGTIEIESNQGEGTRVRVRVPGIK